jgi:8-oxo-dGTP pyrophosphatase MutT (NUDIX family)
MEDDTILARLRQVGMLPKDAPPHSLLNRASVLVPLFLNESSLIPSILLTQRPMTLRSHAGDVCFPGGKQDPEDEGDDVTTALRETHEEVGIPPSKVQPLCRLPTCESIHHLCVTPIVGYLKEPILDPSTLDVSEREVEAAFCVPLVFFLQEPAHKVNVEWSGETFCLRTYYYDECPFHKGRRFKIYGLTAHIAHQVAEIALRGLGGSPPTTTTSPAQTK